MVPLENLETELKQGKLKSLYLFYGEERYLLENSFKKVKALFGDLVKGINFVVIDDTNINGLISELETPAFGYEKKLVVVKNAGLLKKEGKRKNAEMEKTRQKLQEYLKENKKSLEESVVLVILEEEIDLRYGLYKWLDKEAVVCNFEFQKPFQIEKRILGICRAYKVEIDNSALKYFIECVRNQYARHNK